MITQYMGYDIKPHKETPTSYVIVTSGKGGKVPDILNGLFTSVTIGKVAIDAYLESKPKKDNSNDKEISKSGNK